MEIGGRTHAAFSFVVETRTTSALKECSASPVNFDIFHTKDFLVASYFALPNVTRMFAFAVLSGTGTSTTMFMP
jgi:hypothetical protein